MGCLSVLAGLLALAVPASIARASLVGAYIVLALLLVLAVAATRWNASRRRAGGGQPSGRATRVIIVVGVVYAGLIAIIHAA